MPHACEWCEWLRADLESEIGLYSRIIEEADAAAEALGGSTRCKPEDREMVDQYEIEASGHEDDRYRMRECLRQRPRPE